VEEVHSRNRFEGVAGRNTQPDGYWRAVPHIRDESADENARPQPVTAEEKRGDRDSGWRPDERCEAGYGSELETHAGSEDIHQREGSSIRSLVQRKFHL
jgi:hypothetical protein